MEKWFKECWKPTLMGFPKYSSTFAMTGRRRAQRDGNPTALPSGAPVDKSRLGVDNFLLAYAFGLLTFGYAQSPLEQLAYTLQRSFELGTLPLELMRVIEQGTDASWDKATPIVQGRSGGA